MKKNTLVALALIMGLCLFLFACRKDISLLVNGREAASSSLLENAKIWRLQHLQSKNSVLKPLWDDAWTVSSKDRKELLIVPAPEHYIADEKYRIRRFFIFTTSKSEISNGEIVEFLGSDYKVEDNLDFLLKNFEQKTIGNFNGAIIRYDVNYAFLKNTTFENGKIGSKTLWFSSKSVKEIKLDLTTANTRGKLMSMKPSKSMSASECPEPVVENRNFPASYCEGGTVQVGVEYSYSDGCLIKLTRTYLGTTCPSTSGGGSGSGSGSGSGGNGNPPYGEEPVILYNTGRPVSYYDGPTSEEEEVNGADIFKRATLTWTYHDGVTWSCKSQERGIVKVQNGGRTWYGLTHQLAYQTGFWALGEVNVIQDSQRFQPSYDMIHVGGFGTMEVKYQLQYNVTNVPKVPPFKSDLLTSFCSWNTSWEKTQ
ncbi:hypothetical protein [Pedobacter sp. UBA5917]|jgi:hypothetical protein|uniref:hypothetical protein n=1 Tax=Pedobacter sp. UBA5917 TaxID=1947061 RepID=UPI0025F4F99C|nr:hypothetical protein [Pedobacter sp. UBA5917]